jgi:hypothetical protein
MKLLEEPVEVPYRKKKSSTRLTYPLIHTPYYYCDNLSLERDLIVIGDVDMWITIVGSLDVRFTSYCHVYS